MSQFRNRFQQAKTIIGMVHLPPLPGIPESGGIEHAEVQATADLRALEQGGVDGVLVENEYDRPHRVESTHETTAAMTRITRTLIENCERTLIGCEILLNDPFASLAVAQMSGAAFIRTDYFVDRMTRPEYGEFAINPERLLEYRSSIGGEDILILADIQVKYATMIEPRPLAESAKLANAKGADAVVVTGNESGDAPTIDQLREAAQGLPVLIGSGMTPENAEELLIVCDGAIVGTSLMKNRVVHGPAVEALMSRVPGR